MSDYQSIHLSVDVETGHHGENNNVVPSNSIPPIDLNGVPITDTVDANSHVAININLLTDPNTIIHGAPQSLSREAPEGGGD